MGSGGLARPAAVGRQVVAFDFGIPAVVGVREARRFLPDGSTVEVDAAIRSGPGDHRRRRGVAAVSTTDPATFLVLHGLRIKGLADATGIGASTGLTVESVTEVLEELSASGRVVRRDGAVSGWRLTEAGRGEHAALAADRRPAAELRSGLDSFLALDGEVKSICTAWQMRDLKAGVVNDHTDDAYDAAVVARLGPVHDAALAAVAGLTAVIDRFGPYASRLQAAYDRVVAGNRDALTKPLTGSYHDVWMELHEDLLLTLGLDREDTPAELRRSSARTGSPARSPRS